MRLKISDIKQDPKLQIRVSLNPVAISDYAESIRNGASFPPLVVFCEPDTSKYLLSDGWHRIAAAKQAGRTHIGCNVMEGGFDEAFHFALSANNAHGLRRSPADMFKAVESAITCKQYKELSLRKIGKICGVSHEFVRRVKKHLGRRVENRREKEKRAKISKFEKAARMLKQEDVDRSEVKGGLAIFKSFPYDGAHAAEALELEEQVQDLIYVRNWLTEAIDQLHGSE